VASPPLAGFECQTAEARIRGLAACPPELCRKFVRSSHEEGAGKAGHRLAPMVRVQQKKHAAEPQAQPRIPGLPCANGFNGFLRALLGDEFLFVTVATWIELRTGHRLGPSTPPRGLASATDARTTRLRRPRQHRSSCALPIAHEFASPCNRSLRARRHRVHRIPRSTSVTIAIRPSDEAGRAKEAIDYAFGKANCFWRKDWTTQISLMRLDKSPFSRTRFFGHAGAQTRSRDLILPDGRIDQQ
jgi:hypothetical protein